MAVKILKVWRCLRCGHEWVNRKNQKPYVCPRCKSYKWDEVRGNGLDKVGD